MARTTMAYLEGRYLVLEKEIENALHNSPTDDLAIADLTNRKLIIADEIQHNRRLVERFAKTDTFYLTPPRHISTLHETDMAAQSRDVRC